MARMLIAGRLALVAPVCSASTPRAWYQRSIRRRDERLTRQPSSSFVNKIEWLIF
jgi:hypothetical protein